MKVLLFFLVFLILGGLLIISNNNLAIHDGANVEVFFEVYSSWVNQLYLNFQGISGEVVKRDWVPDGDLVLGG